MDVKNLWRNNKLLVIIGAPIIILFLLKDVLISMLVASAKTDAKKANEEGERLKEERIVAEAESRALEAAADEHLQAIEDRKEKEVDEDWHKKL